MNYRMPSYYKDFKCIADKCPDTCCAGWAIVIDETTMKKYNDLPGKERSYVKSHIDETEKVYLRHGSRCSFLNENNLCNLYINVGEDKLCKTCTRYPRHFEEYGNLVEAALSMSCPVACNMIVNNPLKDKYKIKNNNKISPNAKEVDEHLLEMLLSVRRNIFKVTNDRKMSIFERMLSVIDYGARVQKKVYEYEKLGIKCRLKLCRERVFSDINKETIKKCFPKKTVCTYYYKTIKSYIDMLLGLENINDNWPQMIEETKQLLYENQDKDEYNICFREFGEYMSCREYEYEHILNYFLYTYFLGGVYDYNIQAMIKLSVLSTLIIRELGMAVWKKQNKKFTVEDQIKVCYQFSRQIEHSDENLMSLEGILTAHPIFDDEKMLSLIYSVV